jgi:O-antigen ligase
MSRISRAAARVPRHSRPLALRAHEASYRAAALLCLVLLSVVLGRLVAGLEIQADDRTIVLVAAGAMACLAVIVAGPVACLGAIGALAAAGWLPVLVQVGGVDVTLADIFYAGLVGGWLLGALKENEARFTSARSRPTFGQAAALLFFTYAGLTLWHVRIVEPGEFGDSLVSWLRLVQTASLAWLAAGVIRTRRDVTVLLASISAGAVVAIGLTLVEAVTGGGSLLTDRYSAGLNVNALGLVSGLLLVMAVFGGPTQRLGYRLALGLLGLLGLLLAKSVGAFVGTGLALAVGASFSGRSTPIQRATRVVVSIAIAVVLVFGVVQFLRPSSTPTGPGFRESSASQRIILGAAGLEIFERNPLIGVGWRRSDSPRVIGDRDIAAELRSRFPGAKQEFFPDVKPGTVHNTYVQILADLGLIGFSLFVAAIVSFGVAARALLRRVNGRADLWPQAWSASLGLILLFLWLNDNPLFGGQVETIVAALLAGALAGIGRRLAPG